MNAPRRTRAAVTMERREARLGDLLSMDQQQRLVVERTDRLLKAGKPVPLPPSSDLFAARTALRKDVNHIIEDELALETGSPDRHRDMSQVLAARYERILKQSAHVDGEIRKARGAIDNRVEYRDYLNIEAADARTAQDVAESQPRCSPRRPSGMS